MKKILVIGGGGREHAVLQKLSEGKEETELYCAPGNGGISEIAECVPVAADDVAGVLAWCRKNSPDLVFVTPDDPLALGMVDSLTEAGFRAFGPMKEAAKIEWSKAFSKELMKKYGIPTADFAVFEDAEEALDYLQQAKYPIVVKADGLALGKGVLICKDKPQAEDAVRQLMLDRSFGKAGEKIVIEEFLTGPEVSVLSFCDGKTIVPMLSAQDHKRANDNDEGLNTGGMGAFSPTPKFTPERMEEAKKEIFDKTLDALNAEGITYKGVIFFGLILTDNGVKVLEYNARLGDPETQAVLMLLDADLLEIAEAVIDEKLDEIELRWKDECAVCVVLASGGYPQKYETGKIITGLSDMDEDIAVYHAGTKKQNGLLVTSGGRVLGVVACGADLEEARLKAYANIEKIRFENMHYRTDIGKK